MSLRFASRRLASASRSFTAQSAARRQYASVATAASNLAETVKQEISNKAALPNPDPAADSATAAFVERNSPFMLATYVRPLPVMVQGEGSYLWDMENRKYLDFTAGIAVTSLGHSDPEIGRIIADQSQTLLHASNLYHNPWTSVLSKLLIDTTKASGAMKDANQVFICNSGTEANEAAIKFARKVGKTIDPSGAKHEFVSFHQSFHGRTMGALSATPNVKYQKPFSPMLPGFKYGTFNDIEQIDALITDSTCGVIVEPIQGEGGVNVASQAFLAALRARCTAVGAVLIFDEIQCGMSRTGSLWAHAHPDLSQPETVHPDILTTAKALGNGVPIGATIVSENVAPKIVVGDHGTTFGGNPLVCRVAHNVLSRLADPELQSSVTAKSQVFISELQGLQKAFPEHVSEIRGRGLILGLQLKSDAVPRAGEIIAAARERGLLVITAGEGCLRFVPPLTISEPEIKEGIEILRQAMEVVFEK